MRSLLPAGSREEDIRQAEPVRDAAKGQVEAGRTRLDQCVVRAPADGVVLDVLSNSGQFVSTAVPQPLLQVLADGPLHVRTEVGLRDLTSNCVSQRALVAAEASPNMNIPAQVVSIGRTVAPATTSVAALQAHDDQLVPVLLDLDQNASSLPIGSIVTVRFDPCLPKT